MDISIDAIPKWMKNLYNFLLLESCLKGELGKDHRIKIEISTRYQKSLINNLLYLGCTHSTYLMHPTSSSSSTQKLKFQNSFFTS